MAGFVFQAEVAFGKAVELLVDSDEFGQAGEVFVEALSDVAVLEHGGSVVLLQVKRTLTAAALDSAAAEIAAIEAVDAAQAEPSKPCYGVVCQHRDIQLDWSLLPKASPHAALVQGLHQSQRLLAPKQLPNPRWQALAALWARHRDPFGLLRFALDRILHRQVSASDATACWEDIAERFRQGTIPAGMRGQSLGSFDIGIHAQPARRLEVGQRVTWERWRAGQYMRRPRMANDAVRHALALLEQAHQLPSPEVAVFWLAGRSGAGKSVLLLDAVSALVQRGHSVLWLKPEEVEPALAQIANGDGWATPDFLAVDDIYDLDARDRLDIGRISILVDDRGARAWPVLLTCGPGEFTDDFEQQSRYQGFKLQVQNVPLLDKPEAARFVEWAKDRMALPEDQADGADLWSGQALAQSAQGQGLFVSVATELAEGDMRQFGQRFAARLQQHGESFAASIRLCLAVNRLYLRAPAAWLGSEARAHLEDINRDGDFALEAEDTGRGWLRLTHPHLSDAIYPHLLQAKLPRLYAEDLGDAFQRALADGHGVLAQRLLQTFAASAGQARAQRMSAVDDQRLAKRCVHAWRAHPPGGDVRLQAGMRVSLACWPAARASLASGVDMLIAEALQDMAAAEAQFVGRAWWPGWWLRLWAQHPAHPALLDWAAARMAANTTTPAAAWSRVWEAVWQHAQGERRAALAPVARQWLMTQGRRADWRFVWKALRGEPSPGHQAMLDLLVHALPHEDVAHWPHVWQEALPRPPGGRDLSDLLTQGCEWLPGREDEDQWAFVWQALLANAHHLPEGWDQAWLLRLGCEWLPGREDKDQWTFVWEALLANAQRLPEGWDSSGLAAAGLVFVERATVADGALPVLKALLSHRADLAANAQETLSALLARWLPLMAGLPAGPASHFIEAMLDAGLASTTGLGDAASTWCHSHRRHPSWPLTFVKALIAWPHDRRLLEIARELSVWVDLHPNEGWLKKAEGLLRSVDLKTAEPELSGLITSIQSRKLKQVHAAAPVNFPHVGKIVEGLIAGFQPYGVFVRVGASTGLIMASALPPNQREWKLLLPPGSRWQLRITKHSLKGFNASLVDPPW